MTGADALCGIDVGTQGVRAIVATAEGLVLGAGHAGLSSNSRPASGHHEQDPGEWWPALVSAVSGAVDGARAAHGRIAVTAVALDATSGTVLVEAPDGSPRGPALMYDDARASEQAERARRIGAAHWAQMGYRMQDSWALPKVMWLRELDALRPGDRVVHQADHLVRRLVGAPVATDTSTALKTGADLRDATWPEALLDELGVGSLLPELVLPGAHLGTVSPTAAAATGLTPGAAVRAGMTDGCAAQIASGALRTGRWSSALGTTLVLKGSTTELIHDRAGAVYCHRHPDGGWLPGGASSSGAGVIAATLPGADLAGLTSAAAQLPFVAGPTYPLTGTGERFPFVAPAAHGFITEAARSDAERFAALCQSIAFVERLAYDTLAALGADTSGSVAMTGGATGNAWWNQMRCDVLGRPAVLPQSGEAALGMAILAAAEPGRLTTTAERMVRVSRELYPDPERHDFYTHHYRDFLADLANRGWLDSALAGRLLGDEVAR